MGRLKIALLGPSEVDHVGRRVLFPERKTLALLAYLAAEGGKQPRSRLAQLFWPESDTAHGRSALRLSLFHLRDALEENEHPGEPSHLIITYDMLGLDDAADIELDLRVFKAAGLLAQRLPSPETMRSEDRQAAALELRRAAASYRGDFLEDFTLRDAIDFDNWMGGQRQYWRSCFERVVDRLSLLEGVEGAFDQAIETVERWRTFDPLSEAMYLRLMQLHLANGNRVAALKMYQACVDILQSELHAQPSLDLTALAERIRSTSPTYEKQSRTPLRSNPGDTRPYLSIPFVGRGGEFSRLIALYQQVCLGRPQVVVLEGEAGIGKSRLAAAFLDWAKVQGAGVLAGRAYKTHSRLSYQPLLDPLRTWLQGEQQLHQLLSAPWVAELSRLLPELRERYPDLPAPTADETFAPARLLEALARLGQACAARQPLLICIDDIQWMDEATLDACHYLLRHWTQQATPALLLLVRRTETRSIDPLLAEGLANLKHVAAVTHLELGPLSASALLQMVRAFSPQERAEPPYPPASVAGILSPEHFSDWLFAETGGQPFYTIATLEALVEEGVLVPRAIESKAWVFEARAALLYAERRSSLIPANLREMILSRLARLSSTARELLAAGAVLDHDFAFENLCEVAQLPEQVGLSALDEALESLLLRESRLGLGKSGPTAYVFAHDKIREVVYSEAGEARRRIFHGRALHILENRGVSAAELAYHALAGGAPQAAARWSVAAGDEAMRVFAVRDAIDHYQQARQLTEEGEALLPARTSAHLFTQLGRALEHRNDFKAAQSTYQAMLETARRQRDSAMECAALNHLAVLAGEDFSQLDSVMAQLQEALQIAERTGDLRGLAETQWSLARVHYYILNLEASLLHGKGANALACELGEEDLIVRSLNTLAYTTRAMGQFEEAAAMAEEARSLSSARGDRMMEADCLSRIADAHINCGRPHQAVAAARSAYAMSLEIEHPWGQANSGYQLARALAETGAYEEALAIAQESTNVARTLTFTVLLFVNLLTLGLVYQALGLTKEALETHLEGLEVSKTVPSSRYVGLSYSLVCVDCALAGDWETAAGYARQMLVTRDPRVVVCPEAPRWPETEALLSAGLRGEAESALAAFGERFSANRRCHLALVRAQAVLAESQGDRERALHCLREAVAEAAALDLPGELWQAEAALAQLHHQHGEDEPAAQACGQARAVLEKLAGGIAGEELRTRFLASPPVKRLLGREQLFVASREGC